MHYFGPNGATIDFDNWVELAATEEAVRLAYARVGRIALSTVWLGYAHRISEPPLLYETMTFPARHRDGAKLDAWQIQERYHTRAEALAGHQRWLSRLHARGVEALLRRTQGFEW